jgi:hypothetical protein
MFKGKLAVLLVAALLMVSSSAFAGIIDPCLSQATVTYVGTTGNNPGQTRACPQGDGGSLINQGLEGAYISLTIVDGLGQGIANISPTDFYMDDCDAVQTLFILCGGSASSGADSLTNSLGQTTMSNTQPATGQASAGDIGCEDGPNITGPPDSPCPTEPLGSARCSNGVIIIVQGEILEDDSGGCPGTPECFDIDIRSFDMNGSGFVSSADLSIFAIGYVGGAAPHNPCTDFDNSGASNLPDLTIFALHYGPPGHTCF